MADVEKLKDALLPFANAYVRMRDYGPNPLDDAPLFADENNTLFELLNGEQGDQVTVAELRAAYEVLSEIWEQPSHD